MGFFSSIFGWFKGFFSQVAETVIGKAAESIGATALDIVRGLEGCDLNGYEKKEKAEHILKERYPSVESAALNLAIESAVAIVKDQIRKNR